MDNSKKFIILTPEDIGSQVPDVEQIRKVFETYRDLKLSNLLVTGIEELPSNAVIEVPENLFQFICVKLKIKIGTLLFYANLHKFEKKDLTVLNLEYEFFVEAVESYGRRLTTSRNGILKDLNDLTEEISSLEELKVKLIEPLKRLL